jgi:hypothetical protein
MKKVAISVLTKGYDNNNQYNTLITRNNLIYDNIITKSTLQFDMVIFHEGNITAEQQEYISKNSKATLLFRDVKQCASKAAFDDSKNIYNMELCPPNELSERFPVGYKHMCHFWSIDVFEYLSEYQYTIRIDEDCYVDRVDPAVFESVIEQEIKFAVPLICTVLDDPNVIVGLEQLLNKFAKDNNITLPVAYADIKAPNTNFMMLDLDFFRQHEITQKFLLEVENSHGIYSNRWGDAPIWGIILYALASVDFYELSDTGYLHGSHNHYVNPQPQFKYGF